MSTHTPGPWSKAFNAGHHDVFDRNDRLVASIYADECAAADACLIAAAPELLAAMKAIVAESDCLSELRFLQAVSAISKAEGAQ